MMQRISYFVWVAFCIALMGVSSTFAQTNITFNTIIMLDGTDCSSPEAILVQANDGNFYGTTRNGGAFGLGNIFQMTPAGTLTTLFSFIFTNDPDNNSYPYGTHPEAPLIQGNDGNLYGTTQDGGTNGDGTVFCITTNGVLNYSVTLTKAEGANISAGLVQGSDDNFYGVAINGGSGLGGGYKGTIFKMTPGGTVSNLFSFGPQIVPSSAGSYPNGSLVEGKDGDFYGATQTGAHNGDGAIYKIDANGNFTPLYAFAGRGGQDPTGPFVLGNDGNFYGMTVSGGTYGLGTIFKVTTNGTLTYLVNFNGTNGANENPIEYQPNYGPLVLATDGNFYGTTPSGGASNDGTIFMMTPSGTLTTLYSFIGGTNGANPTGLIQAKDGNFFGTTTFTSEAGNGRGIGNGTIFRVSIPLQPVFQSMTQTNGVFTFTWSAVATQTNQLQYTSDLTSTNWTNCGDPFVATNGTMSLSDIMGSNTQRFYRIVLLQ
jgi:uncharacterized repeat protein (TIGR03803 family)